MNEFQLRLIQDAVARFLTANPDLARDVGKLYVFQRLINQVSAEDPGLATLLQDELMMVVAMCWLGPGLAGLPPAGMRGNLLQLIRQIAPTDMQGLLDLVIAFGCGFQRTPAKGTGTWDQQWAEAIRALSLDLRIAVQEVHAWLSQTVTGYEDSRLGWDYGWSDANILALMLKQPEKSEKW